MTLVPTVGAKLESVTSYAEAAPAPVGDTEAVAEVRLGVEKVSVYEVDAMPANVSPLKVTIPELAFTATVPPSDPPDVLTVTNAVDAVTVLFPASVMRTTG